MAKKSTHVVDPTLPKVSVEVNDVTYHLAFDFNALATAESATGLNLLKCLDFQNLSAVSLRALFFAALLHSQPEMTLDAAGSLINAKSAPAVMAAVINAYVDSQAEPEPDLPNVPAPAQN